MFSQSQSYWSCESGISLSYEQELRGLRHATRHFEDNLDVTEVESDIAEIYAHYTCRLLVGLSELIPEVQEDADISLRNINSDNYIDIDYIDKYWSNYTLKGIAEILQLKLDVYFMFSKERYDSII